MLVREPDGGLTDMAQQRLVDVAELLDDLRSGRPFRVRRRSTGGNCTIEVLAEVLAASAGVCGGGGVGLPLLSRFADLFHPRESSTRYPIPPR
jgi:hypothetical protein